MNSLRKLTPRRRKLRLTITALAWAGGLVLVTAMAIHYGSRQEQYRPDEPDEAITSRLRLRLPPEAPEPRLTDVTETAGLGGFRTFHGERSSQLPEDMGGGAAFGDFDNDGDDDLFLVAAGGGLGLPEGELAPSRLYRNRGDGTFEPVKKFPELRIRGMGATWGDFDGDGFIDLAVTGYRALRLFRNENGTGLFSPVELPHDGHGFWGGAAWGDFDNDGHLDLYVCGYVDYHLTEADRREPLEPAETTVPFTLNPASFAPVGNLLFRNLGDGGFAEVAGTLGVDNPEGRSLGAVWHDFDQDGRPDLYVANDVSDNAFYRNEGGSFRDISHAAWVADYRSAMGLAVGDWNNDGDDDLFITHWVAQENSLYDNTYADLYKNPLGTPPASADDPLKPKARFVDIADMRGLGQMSLPYVGWGAEFADLDHDGWLDLLVANGSTLEHPGPLPKRLQAQESFLLWNHAGRAFHNLTPVSSALNQARVSRGLAVADIDADGDLDFVIVDLDGGVRLFRNDMARGNWLQLELVGRRPVPAQPGVFRRHRGEGSIATVRTDGNAVRRVVTSVSYLSQSSTVLHFGLGTAARAESVEIAWHGGETRTFTGLSANTRWRITEGDPEPRRATPGGATERFQSAAPAEGSPDVADERERLRAFWTHHRAGMEAFMRRRDFAGAVEEFERALTLNPDHEDARFYLANSLIELGRPDAASGHLARLVELNPQSLRGHQQWGTLEALLADSRADLDRAEARLQHATRINPEDTGVQQVRGEVALLRGDLAAAEERLAHVCASNERAARAWYLRAYIAVRRDQPGRARDFLRRAREALGPDWQPEGMSHEGDVKHRMHVHATPLSEVFAAWDGEPEPENAFAALEKVMAAFREP